MRIRRGDIFYANLGERSNDTSDLKEKITELNRDEIRAVEKRLLVSLGMSRNYRFIRPEEISEERRKRKLRKEKGEQKRNEVKIGKVNIIL